MESLLQMPEQSVQCCVTSPPYWGLRDYGVPGQFGLEPTPDEFVAKLVAVFREVRRVLRDDGTLWVNLGDSYARDITSGPSGFNGKHAYTGIKPPPQMSLKCPGGSLKPKDLCGIPWMVAFALRADGWYLRSDIIWSKPNCMPESVTDRPTKAHEYMFLLSKSERYFYDHEAVKERAVGPVGGAKTRGMTDYACASGAGKQPQRDSCGGLGGDGESRNKRTVWEVATAPYAGAHFATFPPKLIEPCILAGSRPGDIVLDPFSGSGTTGVVSLNHGRQYIGCELNPDYVNLTVPRLQQAQQQLKLSL
jgi:DNA modification methylase